MRRAAWVFYFCAAALSLAACDGGSGPHEDADAADTPDVPADDGLQPDTPDVPVDPPVDGPDGPDIIPPDGWTPPAGIPVPEFCITQEAPAAPDPWDTPTEGFYYVEETAANATDEGNDCGTPALPRATVPTEIPAGSVVEIHGTYDRGQTSPDTIRAEGTADRPVFIRGASVEDRPVLRNGWEVGGSWYILENLVFAPLDEGQTGNLVILDPTDHGVLRTSELRGNLDGGGLGVVSWSGGETAYVCVYNNFIHDNGDVNADYDQDVHGIAVSQNVHHLWVLDNELARNSGDGIQINAGSAEAQASTHHIYVGRNAAHENKQTGFWTKQAVDVIFSQNVSYGHRPSNSSNGAGMGFQYAPERVWFIFNLVHDCDNGITSGSDSDMGTGEYVYAVGNVITGIHHSGEYNPDTAWSNAAFMFAGGTYLAVVDNTIWDADAGINIPGGGQAAISGNIIAGLGESEGCHVFVEDAGAASASTVDHDLFGGAVRIRWGDYDALDLPAFQSAYPGLGEGCLAADPLFVDAPGGDLQVAPGSPAVGAGVRGDVYGTFLDLYGIDISVDFDGTGRPAGPAWDIGAYEQ